MTNPAHAQSTDSSRHEYVMNRLQHLGMLAVLRGSNSERVVEVASTLIGTGIDIIEITYTVPDCAHVLTALKAAHPGAMIGVGTVTAIAQLDEAVEAGADFIVTPGTTPDLLSALASCGVPFLPGVLTPSEVMAAMAGGAAGVKLFPGSLVGPGGLKALRGPFPDLAVVPTGGVSPDNVHTWLAAGAFAVGAGNDLAPLEAVDSGDQDLIRARARAWLAVLPERGSDHA
jgi:2-dehydro-3-deoxyphosphogluconate aldolase/(4S)-4-hydroxy-2-oxoglutarate aldolase